MSTTPGRVTGFSQVLAERSNGTFSIPVHDVLDNGADTVVVLATHSAQRDDRERQGASDDEA